MSGSSPKYNLVALFAMLPVALLQTAWAAEPVWPQIGEGSDSGICSEAFKIADSAYRSDNFYLYELPTIPQHISSALVLKPRTQYGADISGGDALIADHAIFQKIPKNNKYGNYPRSIYWQITAKNGERFVINERDFGWRGDQYSLFSVKDDVSQEKFLEGYNQETQRWTFTPLIDEVWRPPLMLQEKNTGDIWAIDVGAPYAFLSDWNIYSMGTDGAKRYCTIHFHPVAKTATALLPIAVRRLAILLDGTLGSGANEGTLHLTAGVRTEVMHTWANVAMRPWAALKAQPYNNRERVDTELKKWSHKAKTFHKLYQDISTQYPKAERALADYYKTQFNKNADEANAMAKEALDITFRRYSVFPR
jgi:hypothetical protein